MTAHNKVRKERYFHISRNKNDGKIFNNEKDYEEFIKYLNEYFSKPELTEEAAKSFTIRGRTYKGIPHQNKNFYNKLELIAYKLEPNRFDILIKQYSLGSMKKFIRAISTRYAIYFNKTYKRTGALFTNPYQSNLIKDQEALKNLIHNLHSNFSKKEGVPNHFYSSYPEYLGQRATKWIVPESSVTNNRSDKLDQIEHPTPMSTAKLRIPELAISFIVLLALSSFSVIKIETSAPKNIVVSYKPKSHPQVSGVKTTQPMNNFPTPTLADEVLNDSESLESTSSATVSPPTAKKDTTQAEGSDKIRLVTITITDDSEYIYLHQQPTADSETVSKAKDGDKYELVNTLPGWYEIIFDDGTNAFVSDVYAQIKEEDGR